MRWLGAIRASPRHCQAPEARAAGDVVQARALAKSSTKGRTPFFVQYHSSSHRRHRRRNPRRRTQNPEICFQFPKPVAIGPSDKAGHPNRLAGEGKLQNLQERTNP